MRVLISTIPKGHGGAGAYLDIVSEKFRKKGFYVLVPYLSSKLINKKYFKVIYFLEVVLIRMISFFISRLNAKEVLIYHPQTVGYSLSTGLVKNADKIIYYVLDSSFFCIESYNCYNSKECLNCITRFNPLDGCKSFPRRVSVKRYNSFYEALRLYQEKIEFVCQNNQQKKLVRLSIDNAKVNLEKMLTKELLDTQSLEIFSCSYSRRYDFCFHGNKLEAKGYKLALDISRKLEQCSFIFPFDGRNSQRNIIYKDVTWNSGLRELIQKSQIVLCPSLWSAPVEAAVIKSMLLGKAVAIVDSKFSFSGDLPDSAVIKLTGNAASDAILLNEILLDRDRVIEIEISAKKWAKNYTSNK